MTHHADHAAEEREAALSCGGVSTSMVVMLRPDPQAWTTVAAISTTVVAALVLSRDLRWGDLPRWAPLSMPLLVRTTAVRAGAVTDRLREQRALLQPGTTFSAGTATVTGGARAAEVVAAAAAYAAEDAGRDRTRDAGVAPRAGSPAGRGAPGTRPLAHRDGGAHTGPRPPHRAGREAVPLCLPARHEEPAVPHPSRTPAPLLVPVLSRGRHRNPRKGACFMEMASFLAGERWSDHPACTHPALAALARSVNDCTSDAGRAALAPLIPSVIGLTGQDPLLHARLALLCATRALPVAAEERQRVMAVAALAADRVLASCDGRGPGADLLPGTREALASTPLAAVWARGFAATGEVDLGAHRRHAVPHVIAGAVAGIARSCTSDPDALLRSLLVEAIELCRAAAPRPVRGTARERATTVV